MMRIRCSTTSWDLTGPGPPEPLPSTASSPTCMVRLPDRPLTEQEPNADERPDYDDREAQGPRWKASSDDRADLAPDDRADREEDRRRPRHRRDRDEQDRRDAVDQHGEDVLEGVQALQAVGQEGREQGHLDDPLACPEVAAVHAGQEDRDRERQRVLTAGGAPFAHRARQAGLDRDQDQRAEDEDRHDPLERGLGEREEEQAAGQAAGQRDRAIRLGIAAIARRIARSRWPASSRR